MNLNTKNIMWYGIPFLIRNFIQLFSLPFFTKYLSPQDFGSLALSTIYGVFLVGLLNLGLIAAFERNFFEKEKYKERIELMWTLIIFVFVNIFLGFLITYNIEESINSFFFGKYLPPFLTVYVMTHLGIKSLLQYFYIFYRNSKKAKLYALISTSEAFLSVFFSIFLVIQGEGIVGYSLGQLLAVTMLLLSLIFLSIFKKEITFKHNLLKENLILSLPLTPRVFFATINSHFDRYMLGILNNRAGVGIYDIAQKISNLGFIFMTFLQQVFAPEVFQSYVKNPNTFSKKVGEYLSPFFYLSLFFCLLLGTFSQEIIYLLTTPSFYDAFPLIVILNMLYATYFFGKQPQLLLAKKTKLVSYLSFISVILNIIFNLPLIHYYGIIGAAWGTFFSGITIALVSFYYAQKYAKIVYDNLIYISFILFQLCMIAVLILWYYKFDYGFSLSVRIFLLLLFMITSYKFKIVNKVYLTFIKQQF